MSEYRLLIDGELVPGDLTMEVVNPANEQVLAMAPRASQAQAEAAIAAAKAAAAQAGFQFVSHGFSP